MAKVLWLGDAGCHTGFARVTHSIGERLVTKYGHDVHVLAVNYLGDYVDTPLKLYRPNVRVPLDTYGQSRFVEMLKIVEPDVVVIINDPHIVLKFLFMNTWDEDRILLRSAPIITYMPVDSINYPSVWNMLGETTFPVAMVRHGQHAFSNAELIYHGVDTDTYHPLPCVTSTGKVITTKAEAKAAFGYDPDAFLVLRVDRNSARKDFADTWKALVPVMKKYKDIVVHFHCVPKDEGGDLRYLFTREPDIEDRFYFPAGLDTFHGFAEQDLAVLYNAADLFVSTSTGEGFGLTLAEALACELPVVAQDFSSITEVVGPGGILIPPGQLYTCYAGSDLAMPQVPLFTEAIERLYLSRGARRDLGQKGRAHVVESFSWDTAASQFHDLITKVVTEQLKLETAAQSSEGAP